MKNYKLNEPLVYIHIYKTAGSTVRKIIWKWLFKEKKIIEHYVHLNKITCTSETISNLEKDGIKNPIFYGHFDYSGNYEFPQTCNQFITTLRNPFYQDVSAYFYGVQTGDKNCINIDLRNYLMKSDMYYGFSKVFTKQKLNLNNYKDVINKYFVHIGVVEKMEENLIKLSNIFQKQLSEEDKKIRERTSNYFCEIPYDLIDLHRKNNELEYAIYDYVASC